MPPRDHTDTADGAELPLASAPPSLFRLGPADGIKLQWKLNNRRSKKLRRPAGNYSTSEMGNVWCNMVIDPFGIQRSSRFNTCYGHQQVSRKNYYNRSDELYRRMRVYFNPEGKWFRNIPKRDIRHSFLFECPSGIASSNK